MIEKRFKASVDIKDEMAEGKRVKHFEIAFDVKDLNSMDLLVIMAGLNKVLKDAVKEVCRREGFDPLDVIWPICYIDYQMERFFEHNNMGEANFGSAVITE